MHMEQVITKYITMKKLNVKKQSIDINQSFHKSICIWNNQRSTVLVIMQKMISFDEVTDENKKKKINIGWTFLMIHSEY